MAALASFAQLCRCRVRIELPAASAPDGLAGAVAAAVGKSGVRLLTPGCEPGWASLLWRCILLLFGQPSEFAHLAVNPGRSAQESGSTGSLRAAPSSPSEPSGGPTQGQLKIVVLEQGRTHQTVIRKVLSRAGHELTIVDTAEAALAAINNQIDVIVLDLNSGDARLVNAIRSQAGSRAWIVLIARPLSEALRMACEQAGANRLLEKPLQPGRMLEAVAGARPVSGPPRAVAAVHQAGLPVIDPDTLASLERLGGLEFVGELTRQFLEDAAGLLAQMPAIITANDLLAFKEQIHALRSAAANIGARRMYQVCLGWRNLDQAMLAEAGPRYHQQLMDELDQVQRELASIQSRARPQAAASAGSRARACLEPLPNSAWRSRSEDAQ